MAETLFSYSGPSSYRSFLADKPSVDGVNLLVNLHMAKSLATQNDLSRRGIQVIETAAAQASAEMAILHAETSQVQRRLEDLSGIIQNGFNAVSLELNGIGQSLSELVNLAKTPDQTWAFEQYSIASDAYQNGHIEEALDYVDRAISGHRERSGFRLEHRFHALRGLIHLGGPGVVDLNIVDLEESSSDFELALKYADQTDEALLARYRSLLGWTYYCLGQFDKAQHELETAIELDQDNARAYYDLAKVLVRSDQIEDGLRRLESSFRTDWLFGVRATGDADFSSHLKEISDRIDLFRTSLVSRLQYFIGQYKDLNYRHRQALVVEFGIDMSDSPAEFFEAMEQKLDTASIAELLEDRGVVSDHLDIAYREAHLARRELEQKRDEVRSSFNDEAPFLIAFLFAAICVLVTFVFGWINSIFIVAVVAAAIVGFVTYFASYLIVVPLVFLILGVNAKVSASRSRNNLTRVLEEFGTVEVY